MAVTIDDDEWPHDVLLLRGRATVEVQPGVVPEYAAAAKRYMGEEGGHQWIAQIEGPHVHMARIGVRPEWVGTLDFQKRLPSSMGGVLG